MKTALSPQKNQKGKMRKTKTVMTRKEMMLRLKEVMINRCPKTLKLARAPIRWKM
jgi:hypothetical protein